MRKIVINMIGDNIEMEGRNASELRDLLSKIIRKYRKYKGNKMGIRTDDQLKWALENNIKVGILMIEDGGDIQSVAVIKEGDDFFRKDGKIMSINLSKRDRKMLKKIIGGRK